MVYFCNMNARLNIVILIMCIRDRFTVPADTVEYRYTAMGFLGDAVGNLFIFFGENKELNGLPGTVRCV